MIEIQQIKLVETHSVCAVSSWWIFQIVVVLRFSVTFSRFTTPMDSSLPGSSIHGISQARILGWVAISYSRGYSQPRDRTCVFCTGKWVLSWTCLSWIGRWALYRCTTWEALGLLHLPKIILRVTYLWETLNCWISGFCVSFSKLSFLLK